MARPMNRDLLQMKFRIRLILRCVCGVLRGSCTFFCGFIF